MCLWDGLGIRTALWGSSHKSILCLNSFGLFFSGASGTVEVVGVQRLFALEALA